MSARSIGRPVKDRSAFPGKSMKLGIQSRLFLAFTGVIVLVVLAMMVAVNWSFQRGLGHYLDQVENQRLDKIAATLASAYGEAGDWSFIRHNLPMWASLLDQALGQSSRPAATPFPDGPSPRPRPSPSRPGIPPFSDHGDREPTFHPPNTPPDPFLIRQQIAEEGHRAPGAPPGPPSALHRPPLRPPPSTSDFRLRLRLLDQNDQPVFGPRDVDEAETRREVTWKGQTIGFLALRQNSEIFDELAEGFELEQRRTYLLITLLALLLAATAAMLLARRLLEPVRQLAAGARALGSGAYDTRIETDRTDEFGLLAEDFNRLALALARNEEVRRQWIADISHELRTPLAVLRSEIEALVDGIRQATPERLQSLHQEVVNLSELVNDLYELALSDIGALDYRHEPLDLATVIQQVSEGFRPRLAEKGLTLLNRVDHPLPMKGDGRRLQQLFTNLMENSQRYTETGGRIEILVLGENGECQIVVQDTDPGVPGNALPQLFDRLYRVDKSRSRQMGGAGLGLAICRNIVTAHAGRIEACQSPLGGLAIHIWLPLSR